VDFDPIQRGLKPGEGFAFERPIPHSVLRTILPTVAGTTVSSTQVATVVQRMMNAFDEQGLTFNDASQHAYALYLLALKQRSEAFGKFFNLAKQFQVNLKADAECV